MHLHKTKYSKKTNIGYVRFDARFWYHVDFSDTDKNHPPRQVGRVYESKAELLADHIPYLLRAGWLKLGIPLPEPQLIYHTSGLLTCRAFEMTDNFTGIRILEDTKAKAIQLYVDAIEETYGPAVIIIYPKSTQQPSQQAQIALT